MSVFLSPVGGAGAQFFDNNGIPLTGGKLYTYLAGTTTPAATYTSSSGGTAHANPIVLDAAGRVSGSSEIWLTSGVSFKFILKTSADVTIGTWDDINGNGDPSFSYYTPAATSLLAPGPLTIKSALDQITNRDSGSSVIGYLAPFTGAVRTAVDAKLAETVNVKDFGAVCDGVADDTDAVQTAIDYCLANHKDLLVEGRCKLTASLNIDKPVDDPSYDEYFTILSVNNGGFLVESAIPMFSSTIAFTTLPVVALVRFQNIVFECSNSSLNAYVLNDGRFLRTVFFGCTFSKIKLLNAVASLTQSIYLLQCNVRRVVGIFFNSDIYTYDFKMVNCLVEAVTGSALRLNNPVGCSVVSSCIEGISGTAIIYDGAQALDVTGSYFEANGLDIDGTDGGTSTSLSYGVCLNGNYFSNSTATYTIKWGQMTSGCISIGNWHTGNMHDVTAGATGLVTFDTAQGSLSNIPNIAIIQGGFNGQFTGVVTGVTTTVSDAVQFNKVGSTVTLKFLTMLGTSNTTACTITGLPVYLRPVKQQVCVARVRDNGTVAYGNAIVSEIDGTIVLGVGADSAVFTASGTKGIESCTITYSLT